jgi:acyl dehydratase
MMADRLASLIGVTQQIGSHRFLADEILRFARRYDPQPFHVDPEAAKHSQFGELCASGWQTVAQWMQLNVRAGMALAADVVELGPSPGFQNLKWLRPVYAGDTISYARTILSVRRTASRVGWSVYVIRAEGRNQNGDPVLECECAALVRLANG